MEFPLLSSALFINVVWMDASFNLNDQIQEEINDCADQR